MSHNINEKFTSALSAEQVYSRGQVKRQFVTLAAFDGTRTTDADVEWHLVEAGVQHMTTELSDDPRYARREQPRGGGAAGQRGQGGGGARGFFVGRRRGPAADDSAENSDD